VLSFPSPDFYQARGYIGDLVICAPYALKQAKFVQHDWRQEVHVLIVHGLLHLVGFDHEVSLEAEVEMAHFEKVMLDIGRSAGIVSAQGLILRSQESQTRN
jgi:rRNA maturation RNase YbeY